MTRALLTTVLLAGCYAPDARDCTVKCSASTQCLSGEVCGSDGFCASSKVAGHCAMIDAGPQVVQLSITIMGSGQVVVDAVGTCDADTAPHHACTFPVAANAMRTLAAIATDQDHPFVGWTDACAGNATTCALVPVTSPTQVGAKFQ